MEELPKKDLPILAKIETQGDLGRESWFEVVWYNNHSLDSGKDK